MSAHSEHPDVSPTGRQVLGAQVGDKFTLMSAQGTQSLPHLSQASVGDKSHTHAAHTVNPEWETSRETSVNSCGPRSTQSGRHCVGDSVEDKWETLVSHSGFLGPHEFTPALPHLSPRVGDLGPTSVNSCLGPSHPESPTLGALGRVTSVSHACQETPTLVSHTCLNSGCLGPHEFTLSPTCGPRHPLWRQVWADNEETSVNSCGPSLPLWVSWSAVSLHLSPPCKLTLVSHTCLPHLSPTLGSLGRMSLHLSNSCLPHCGDPLWETLGDMGRHLSTHVGPRNPEWETSVGDKCGRHLGVGDKCKLMRPADSHTCLPRVGDKWETSVIIMRPKEPRVGDKCGRQVWETSVASKTPKWETSVGDMWETSVNSCVPSVTQSGERQVWESPKWETSVKIMRPKAPRVGDHSGRQVGDKCTLMRPTWNPEWETSVGDKCGRQV